MNVQYRLSVLSLSNELLGLGDGISQGYLFEVFGFLAISADDGVGIVKLNLQLLLTILGDAKLISRQEDYVQAILAFATSAACSVDEAVYSANIELEDTVDVFDIKPTGSYVSGH